ncbi:hypothetical protein Q31b_11280 [Novipirellula aureliae]|uniref:Histidine kinase/HSP90-like ATPase domain-containing protein n=1 Tax=Novipirellula aureliae TaxID=2527966 RepID=A0A5C6EAB8_9BACT|nr:ATPase [Novipirellula aureliae]TWU45952.1 hypothetical protein Q31b_11280 [Novipirellula aureliae]
MSHHWIDPKACQSLAILVETVSCALLTQHSSPICVEVDVEPELPVPGDGEKIADLVRNMVGQAIEHMGSKGGELMITAVDSATGVELEIADSGPALEERHTTIPFAAAALGAKVRWQNCPQGGVAATVAFRPQAGASRMAA